MTEKKVLFGTTKNQEATYLYRIKNTNRLSAFITDYGATLVSLLYEDHQGICRDLVLGYENVTGYEENSNYFGAIIGRNANRIENSVVYIGDQEYRLEPNERQNNLHSGAQGYSHRLWKVVQHREDSIRLRLYSEDLDQGFPGALEVYVTYTITPDNALDIRYEAMPEKDTIVNLTNHAYFNLNGHESGSVEEHLLWLDAHSFTAVKDSTCIPSGEILEVLNTPMDFTTEKTIGRDIQSDYQQLVYTGGYDHNYVLDNHYNKKLIGKATGNISKIQMAVYTDMPGVQFYAGNFIGGSNGKQGISYGKRHGFCLETQCYPDATKHQNFPSPVVKAGELFESTTTYQFSTSF